jgi:hypothetical protein
MYARVILRVRMWLLTVFPRSCSSSPWQGRMFSGRILLCSTCEIVKPSRNAAKMLDSQIVSESDRHMVRNSGSKTVRQLDIETVTQ